MVPAAFVLAGSTSDSNDVVKISRGTAVVLLICYAAYLVFQLYTHKYLYTLEASKLYAQDPYEKAGPDSVRPDDTRGVFHMPSMLRHDATSHVTSPPAEISVPAEGSQETAAADNAVVNKKDDDAAKVEDEEEEPQLKVIVAVLLLVIVTIITGITAEFLVSSINGMTTKSHVNTEFVALILLPLVVRVCVNLLCCMTYPSLGQRGRTRDSCDCQRQEQARYVSLNCSESCFICFVDLAMGVAVSSKDFKIRTL